MRHVKIITTSGYSWEANINGTDKDIKHYYLGGYFNVGKYPIEKMEQVVEVVFIK